MTILYSCAQRSQSIEGQLNPSFQMKKLSTIFTLYTSFGCFCAAAFALIAQPAHADSAAPRCHYINLATLPVETTHGWFVVQGSINGKTAPMMIDTGAVLTTLTSQGVDYFGLTLYHSPVTQVGVSGESMTYETVVDDIALGKFHGRPNKRLSVAMDSFSPYKVIVGTNIMLNADLEFNSADRTIKFFEAENCSNTFLAYWNKDALDVALTEMSSKDRRQVVTVEINGQKLRAIIDSGAKYSLLNKAFAARLGITPESPNVTKIGSVVGIGSHKIDTWLVKFDSFSIGDETVKNPSIRMSDLWGAARADEHNMATSEMLDAEPDMLLGVDFLRTHHVLLALSQHRLYFSYEGGAVFPPPKPAAVKVRGDAAKIVE